VTAVAIAASAGAPTRAAEFAAEVADDDADAADDAASWAAVRFAVIAFVAFTVNCPAPKSTSTVGTSTVVKLIVPEESGSR
jgi:hypothetical protein